MFSLGETEKLWFSRACISQLLIQKHLKRMEIPLLQLSGKECFPWQRLCCSELLPLSLRNSVIFYGVSFENAAHQSSFGVLVGFGTLLFSRTWFEQCLSTPPSIPGSLRRVESLNCPKSLSMRSWEQNPFSKVQLGFETPIICKRKYLDEICSRLCSFCSHNFVLENSKRPCVPSALRGPTSSLLGAQEKTRSLFSQGIQHECFSRTW